MHHASFTTNINDYSPCFQGGRSHILQERQADYEVPRAAGFFRCLSKYHVAGIWSAWSRWCKRISHCCASPCTYRQDGVPSSCSMASKAWVNAIRLIAFDHILILLTQEWWLMIGNRNSCQSIQHQSWPRSVIRPSLKQLWVLPYQGPEGAMSINVSNRRIRFSKSFKFLVNILNESIICLKINHTLLIRLNIATVIPK